MYNICIFGGTTEGRKLQEFLSTQPISITTCVATGYGEELLDETENTMISAKRLSKEEIKELFINSEFNLVVDATHPFASDITENIFSACEETNTEYLRLLREEGDTPENAIFVDNTEQAAAFLDSIDGNILLTTGSKELLAYRGVRDFSRRVFVRILPMQDSLTACQIAGTHPSHVIAMQGPFSVEMNLSLLRQFDIRVLVTKESGKTGGFLEKAEAAKQAGVKLVIIGRPKQKKGENLSGVIRILAKRFQLSFKPEVTVVGIGPGSRATMTAEVSDAIRRADCLIGSSRMTKAVARPGQAVFIAIDPEKIASLIEQHREYMRVAVVMSGDVGFFSGTKKLLPLLKGSTVRVLPGLNSMVYLCAKLGLSYEDVIPVSLHGREHNIVGDVRKHRKVFVLVGGKYGIKSLCTDLSDAGLGQVTMTVGERLSYSDEKISSGTVMELSYGTYDALSVALIENADVTAVATGNSDAVVTHGLPDEAFSRSDDSAPAVPMTKSEVRSVCLSKLQLTRESICWDVGAGTGSVSVEMALQASCGEVYAIEQKENAIEVLNTNIEKFGLDNLTVVAGQAPAVCENLPAPSRVFIGGSSGNMKAILNLVLLKNPEAIIVATAISLESAAELTDCIKAYSFDSEVVLLNVSRSRVAGAYHLMTAQNPIYIFTMKRMGVMK